MRNLLYESRMGAFVLVLLLVMVFPPCLLFAAEAAPEEIEQAEVLTAVQMRMQQKVNVDFRETPIEDVLRMLGKQADVDIVKSPAVTGNVTATLTDVPLAEALDNILAAHGYGYIATENMIRIVPRKEIYDAPEKLVDRVYKVTYADVKELEKALKKFISKRGSLSAMPGTSNIIVIDTESTIQAIDKFIKEVDRVTQQVLVEVRIYDVTDTDDFDLNIEWTVERNILDSSSPRNIFPATPQNAFPPLEAGNSASNTFTTPLDHADPYAGGSWDETNGGSIRLGFFNDAVSFDLLFSTLQKQEWATLLANPSILVLDNETAKFEIIREIPYTENERSSTGGSTLTSTEFKEVGVKLEVTPHITRDDMLRLHIMPEFGVAEGQVGTSGGGLDLIPAVNTRRLDTIALLKNGQTVVIGGLRKQESSKNLYKTPFFGDLPFFGGLFRSENETTDTTELLVFITPRIIDVPVIKSDEAETYEYTNIPKVKYPPLDHLENNE